MRKKYQTYIIAGVLGLAIIALIAIFFWGGSALTGMDQEVSTTDPANTVLDFYDPWLTAVQDSDTDPYQAGLADTPILSKELRARLSNAKDSQDELDPVLCQASTPSQISARPIYESEGDAQVLVMSRGEGRPEQAIVKLLKHNNGWYIDDIECTGGEFAPEREFDFEQEGYLLKSVQPPLDPQYWHIVFEQNGQQGHTAPLFFDEESTCIDADGSQSVCSPDEFVEPARAVVRGAMTESGVEVKEVELK